jgi:branched-chain amino acid transport system substrate-binding protein
LQRAEFSASTAAIIYVNSDYGTGLKDKFTRTFENEGGKIVSSETYITGMQTTSKPYY